MGETTTSWSDFLQNSAGQILGTGLAVYKSQNVPASIDPQTGRQYIDGQSYAQDQNNAGGGISPMVLLLGAAVIVAVLVMK